MALIRKITPLGNSQCIPVPKSILELVNLSINDNIQIVIENNKLIISPVPVKKENKTKE